MSKTQSAFVVMPIKKVGSDEHQHYRALYEEILKPTLEAAGFSVQRVDDVQKTGAITKDIILRLADADLVVADLTDLNPNVFYELGVRHALRRVGTVMIIDELRTTDIPFDLSAYRVIMFKSVLNGIGRLRAELTAYASSFGANGAEKRDNPVHDWLPVLPVNSLEAASGTTEGKLREQLAEAKKIIGQYEKSVGIVSPADSATRSSPLEVLLESIQDAADGNLASDLLEAAQQAVNSRNPKAFLAVLRRVIERPNLDFDSQDFRRFTAMAQGLGLPHSVAGAILEHALTVHSNDEELKRSQLSILAHSNDPRYRQQAREELATIVGIKTTDDGVIPPSEIEDGKLILFGIMLDTLHEDGLDKKALRVAKAFADRFPGHTIICRNMARALATCGQETESWKWYKKAIMAPDASDVSAVWYGNALHNARRNVDATEAYLVACKLDPDDGINFAHTAEELALAWAARIAGTSKERVLPEEIDSLDVIRQVIAAAFSCYTVDPECIVRCRNAARFVEMSIRDIEALITRGQSDNEVEAERDETRDSDADREGESGLRRKGAIERVGIARSLYDQLKSEVSLPETA